MLLSRFACSLRARATHWFVSAVLGLAFSASAARAQNLLQNGSFESSTFTSSSATSGGFGYVNPTSDSRTATVPNWTWAADPTAGSTSTFGLSRAGAGETSTVPDGSLAVVFGAGSPNSGGSITQNFTTTAGSLYIANLWVMRIGAGQTISASATVKSSGSTVTTVPIDMSGVAAGQWKQVTFTFTAPSANLSFTFTDTTPLGAADSTDLALDDVSVQAASTQSSTILGGFGTTGTLSSNTEFTLDGGTTWHPAYLVGSHPWGFIPGTNNWINQANNETTGLNTTTLYRVKFTAPDIMASPSMQFTINADNVGTMIINGHSLGDTVGGFPDSHGAYPIVQVGGNFIVPGQNIITIALKDTGGLVGMNFRIDLTAIAAQPITIIPVGPDTTPPVLSLPANMIVEATSAAGAVATYTATATDNVDGFVPVTLSPVSGSTFPLGTTTVTATAHDNAGNSASGSFTVTVHDTTRPALSLPSNITAEATSASGAVVNFSATATDAVTTSPTIGYSKNPGTTFALGTTTVNVTATDAAGNVSTGSFTVTVQDTIAPNTAITSQPSAVSNSASATFTFNGSDSGSGVASFQTKLDGNGFVSVGLTPAQALNSLSDGSHTFQVRAVDAAGNFDTTPATFTWTVDTTAPDTTITSSPAALTKSTSATFAFTGSDTGSGIASFESKLDGAAFAAATSPVVLSNLAPGTHTFQVRAKDNAGNVDATPATFTWDIDNTAPVLTLPANIVAEATNANGAIVTFSASATDAHDGSVPVTLTPTSGGTFPLGGTTINATATDAAGNSATGNFTVTVRDTTPPVISVSTAADFSENFSGYTPGPGATNIQYQSGLTVGYLGDVPGWTKDGLHAIHAVNLDGHGNWAVMIWQDNVITSTRTTTDNASGADYVVHFNAGPAVDQDTSQLTSATDGLLIQILRADNTVLQQFTYHPGAWSGAPALVPVSFHYTGDGSGALHLSVGPSAPNSGRFGGTIDDISITPATPADINVVATSPDGAAATWGAAAYDLVSGSVPVTASTPSGSTFAIGTTPVTLTAADAAGNPATTTFHVNVTELPPVITSAATMTGTFGVPFSYQIAGTNWPTLFSANNLPANLSCDPATGLITGTPTQAGTFNVALTAINLGGAGNATLRLTIPQVTPTLAWTAPAAITYGTALSATQLNATASVPGTFSYSPAAGTVLSVGSQTLSATFTPTDTTDYVSGGTVSTTITVNPIVPVTTISAPVLTVPSNITVNAASASGTAVTFNATATSAISSELYRRTTTGGEAWKAYTISFTPTITTNYRVRFKIVASDHENANSDNTFFLDNVHLLANAANTELFHSGFEAPSVGGGAQYISWAGGTNLSSDAPFGDWIFTDYAGVLPATGAWGNVAAEEGSQYALVQGFLGANSSVATAGQYSLVAGQTYTLTYFQATRPNGPGDGGSLTYAVTLESTETDAVTATPIASGGTFPIGSTTVNLSATNSVGDTTTGSFHVNVNQIPVAIALGNLNPTYTGTQQAVTVGTTPAAATSITYDGSATPPTKAGNYKVVVTVTDPIYIGSKTDTLVIAKADPTIAITPYSVTYNGAAQIATGSAAGVQGETLAGLDLSGTTHTGAGAFNDTWTFTDATGNYNNATGTVTDAIAKAAAVITVTPYNVTFDGASHVAAGIAIGVRGEALGGFALGGTAHTNAGTFSDAWSFTDPTGNYVDASGIVGDAITKANATVNVTAYSVTYDAAAHTATGSVTGVGGAGLAGLDLSGTTHTGADTFNDTWAFSDATGNYNNASGSVADAIAKANATVSVTPYSVTYDGNAHTATGGVTGVGGVTLAGLNLGGTTHTNAGGFTDTWTFTDVTGNYNNASASVSDAIAKAAATVAVTPYTVTYDAAAHAATGTTTGVKGEALAGLALAATTHTNAGTYADTWVFTDVTGNYLDASDQVTDTINKANATIAVAGYTGIYDGHAHGATGTATGVSQAVLSSLLNLGDSFTNVPGGTANWKFHDLAGNYNDASGSVAIVLGKADATVAVAAYSVTYDGAAHLATGSVKGVSSEPLAGLDLSATKHTAAGTFADAWTFTDTTGNYNNATATISDHIDKAAATIVVTPYSVTYDGVPHTATGTAKGVQGELLAGLNLAHTTHTAAGSYPDTWTFNDLTGNYNVAGATVTDKIAQASATITLAPLAQMYDGTPKPVTATTTETPSAALTVDITYAGNTTAPTLPGTYVVVATVDDPNYTGSVTSTLTIGVTALIRHGVTLDGDVDGSLQILTGENMTLNGNAGVTGDLLVPGLPTARLNGHPTFAGTKDGTGATTPSNYTVTLNGNALLRYLVRRTDPLTMPTVAAPATPTGTRSVNLNKSTDPIGAWATLKDLTLNGNVGNVAVPAGVYGSFNANGGSSFTLGVAGATTPSVYEFQSFTLNGNTALNIVGPVTIILKGDLNLNGTSGNTAHPEWLDLRVASGGVTLNGNVTFHGYVTAPSGTVTINGNSTLTGGVTADKLVVNGNSSLIEP